MNTRTGNVELVATATINAGLLRIAKGYQVHEARKRALYHALQMGNPLNLSPKQFETIRTTLNLP